MSVQGMLFHRCDIYHIQDDGRQVKYGVPLPPSKKYGDMPDLKDVPCYWEENSQSISQGTPNNRITQNFSVIFPIDADIRVNDQAVFNGETFVFRLPVNVMGHHWEVTAVREGDL